MIIFKDIISSRSNPTVKWVASLSDKKGRYENSAFIAEGEKLTFEALDHGLPVTHIFLAESKSAKYLSKINKYENNELYEKCQVITLSNSAFEKISTEKAPQGIISVIKYLDFFRNMDIIYKEEFFISEDERALALYSLRDPSNLGAVIRSAVAFGVNHIVLTSDSADIYNPKTVRAAMGTIFKIRVTIVSDFASFVDAARACGRRIFAAELSDNAKSIKDVGVLKSDIFVIGNEGHGIDAEISSKCTASVFIPISAKAESLNASVAAAVFMWEQNSL